MNEIPSGPCWEFVPDTNGVNWWPRKNRRKHRSKENVQIHIHVPYSHGNPGDPLKFSISIEKKKSSRLDLHKKRARNFAQIVSGNHSRSYYSRKCHYVNSTFDGSFPIVHQCSEEVNLLDALSTRPGVTLELMEVAILYQVPAQQTSKGKLISRPSRNSAIFLSRSRLAEPFSLTPSNDK